MSKHITIQDNADVKAAIGLNANQTPLVYKENALGINQFTIIVDANDVPRGYTLTTIPNNLFTGDPLLKKLVIGNSVIALELGAFSYCTGLTGSLTIPDSVTTIEYGAFQNCTGFTGSLTLPNNPNFTTIGDIAFAECSNLTGSLIIPDSVTSIGIQAFYNCSGFNGLLTIGNSVTTIGSSAFEYCSNLTGSLTIPDSVTSIGVGAFAGCTNLTGSLTLPNNPNFTSIGVGAFAACSGFTGSLIIPDSVTSIGQLAFYDCSSLQDIYVNADESIWGTFSLNDTGSGPIYVTTGNLPSYGGAGAGFQGHQVVEWTSYPYPMS